MTEASPKVLQTDLISRDGMEDAESGNVKQIKLEKTKREERRFSSIEVCWKLHFMSVSTSESISKKGDMF